MSSPDDRSGLDRRALARRIAALVAAASVSPLLLGASEPAPAGAEDAAARVATALAASPASLTPQQRLEVRNGVRDLQKTLAVARARELPNDAEPAFLFHTVLTP
ncbi:MAG: hypothetical protein ABIT01_02370 [Thermoanaerobaculia bacterium]